MKRFVLVLLVSIFFICGANAQFVQWTFEGVTLSGTAATSPSVTVGSAQADAGTLTAGSAFTGEVTKVLKNNDALRAANTNLVFKSVGTLAGAWVVNTAADVVINTKHGPSMVTWAADLASPAVLFTNKSMLTKFGVVTGSHLLAKLYDKATEKE